VVPDFVFDDLTKFSAVYAYPFDEFIGALEEPIFEYTCGAMSDESIGFHFAKAETAVVLFASHGLVGQRCSWSSCARSEFVEDHVSKSLEPDDADVPRFFDGCTGSAINHLDLFARVSEFREALDEFAYWHFAEGRRIEEACLPSGQA
jgi:hypothetical protein